MDPDKDRPTAKKEMAAPDSLYHEVKKLIRIRQSHKALQSRGKITFVYAEKNAYPLAYILSLIHISSGNRCFFTNQIPDKWNKRHSGKSNA